MSDCATSPVGSVDHLSPPSTSSRLSDSEPDPSDLGDADDGALTGGMAPGAGPLLPPHHHARHGRSAGLERSVRSDGASVSSMGSSSRYATPEPKRRCCHSSIFFRQFRIVFRRVFSKKSIA